MIGPLPEKLEDEGSVREDKNSTPEATDQTPFTVRGPARIGG